MVKSKAIARSKIVKKTKARKHKAPVKKSERKNRIDRLVEQLKENNGSPKRHSKEPESDTESDTSSVVIVNNSSKITKAIASKLDEQEGGYKRTDQILSSFVHDPSVQAGVVGAIGVSAALVPIIKRFGNTLSYSLEVPETEAEAKNLIDCFYKNISTYKHLEDSFDAVKIHIPGLVERNFVDFVKKVVEESKLSNTAVYRRLKTKDDILSNFSQLLELTKMIREHQIENVKISYAKWIELLRSVILCLFVVTFYKVNYTDEQYGILEISLDILIYYAKPKIGIDFILNNLKTVGIPAGIACLGVYTQDYTLVTSGVAVGVLGTVVNAIKSTGAGIKSLIFSPAKLEMSEKMDKIEDIGKMSDIKSTFQNC